jgi:hypothetical protein
MTEQGPPDPEQLPPTHRAYGDRADQPSYQPYAPQPPQQPMYGPPQPGGAYGYAGPALPEHPQVTTALVTGLVALIGGFACGLPIVAGPFAWQMGARVRKEIDREPGRYSGREKATAAMVMGIVATGFLALALLVVMIAVVVIIAAA